MITCDPAEIAAAGVRPSKPTTPGARCSCARPTCSASSASCAATSPARRGPSTRRAGTMHGAPLPAGYPGERAAARAGLHAVDQGRDRRPRREHHLRRGGRTSSARTTPSGPRPVAHGLRCGRRSRPPSAGIIIADTKFELGFIDGELRAVRRGAHARLVAVLAGRRVEARHRRPPSFDKQPVRDLLAATGWDKEPPPPPITGRRWSSATRSRYVEAYEIITGRSLQRLVRSDSR